MNFKFKIIKIESSHTYYQIVELKKNFFFKKKRKTVNEDNFYPMTFQTKEGAY